MKKTVVTFFLVIFGFVSINIHAGNIKAYLSHSTFYSPKDGPYIETYLVVLGKSIVYEKNENNKFQGVIEVTLIFKQGDKIVNFDKYDLHTLELEDTSNIAYNVIDQQRILLPSGEYDFEMQIADKKSGEKPVRNVEKISINYPEDKVCVSDIELVDSYSKTTEHNILSKAGYDIIPFIVNFYPEGIDQVIFYAEIYNTNKIFGEQEKYIVKYFVESFETQNYISDLIIQKIETTKPVNIVFSKFDISYLPSGNYNLVVEVRDKQNKHVASKKLFFQRSNPKIQFQMKDIAALDVEETFAGEITNSDSLKEFIRSLSPISMQSEMNYARMHISKMNIKTMQQYFLNFWLKRDIQDPEQAWKDYKAKVKRVNKYFKVSIKRGYETDRGIVYLKYGPPTTIVDSPHEPMAYPYQIWHYQNLNNQRNRRFVFCNRDMSTNDFELIYGDAVGEDANMDWKQIVMRDKTFGDMEEMNEYSPSHFGSKVEDYFINPR